MWSLFQNVVNYALSFIFRGATIKFVFFTAIAYLITALTSIASALLSAVNFQSLTDLMGQLPDGLLFFLSVFRVEVGIPMILAAWAARFAIRRIPVIG